MTTLSERLAWLAGLIDGEGCLLLAVVKVQHRDGTHKGNNYLSYLDIVNTDVRMLERAAEIGMEVGAVSHLYSRTYATKHISKKFIYVLRFDRQHMRRMLEAVLPHLVGKCDQAEQMLAYFRWRSGFNPQAKRDGSLAAEAERVVRQYKAQLTVLKQKGAP